MSMGSEIISTITEAFQGTLEGSGTGIVNFFQTLLQTSEGQMTALGIFALTFTGLGLAVWMIRKLMRRV